MDAEVAAAVLLPHFDAVRDVFAAYRPEPGVKLDKIQRIRFVIDPEIRDKQRHFAGTSENGLRQFYAPEIVDLGEENLIAIIAHEFGHSVDFLYPARWLSPPDGPGLSRWLTDADEQRRDGDGRFPARAWRRLWRERGADQVEWAADGIAQAITGRKIGYCGPCLIQCFSGIERPMGLR